jgi:hypothetical protein
VHLCLAVAHRRLARARKTALGASGPWSVALALLSFCVLGPNESSLELHAVWRKHVPRSQQGVGERLCVPRESGVSQRRGMRVAARRAKGHAGRAADVAV